MSPAIAQLGVLICGHIISQWLRTLPAIAAGGLFAELGFTEQGLAIATGLMAVAFMVGQIPVGVMIDRLGPRRTAMILLGVAAVGAGAAAAAPTQAVFALAQVVAGFGCAGLMMAPLSFAARTLPMDRFGAVSGYLPGVGAVGLLLSGSPSAALIAWGGWRLAYAVVAGAAAIIMLAVARFVPELPPSAGAQQRRSLAAEAADVCLLLVGRQLRAPVVLAIVGYAALIGLRGLWAGPWLTTQLGFGLADAGNVLAGLSVLMIAGPILFGWLDRRLPDRALAMGVIHLASAVPLALLAAGGFGRVADIAAMAVTSFGLTSHVLLYPMTRGLSAEASLGRSLSAVNLGFFLGVAVLQPLSGVAARMVGIGGAFALYAAVLAAGSAWFLALVRSTPRGS
ncbi:MFS transporter [Elioraea sp.]|uniref:MFS transporter n=1 Tax=Elioraea sp. TaxID=2185103 RepID=UPI0025C6F975|nr:MFS transporter [Elioraea sp.]